MEDVKYLAMAVANASEEIKWLTLMGDTDLGKSHLAMAACRMWLEKGKAARYINVPMVLRELRQGYETSGEGSYNARLDFFCKVGFIALDDLGTENITQWGCEQLQIILNYRYDNELHTMITTNRPLDDLFYYKSHPREEWRFDAGERVRSRLERERWCRVVVLEGQKHMFRQEVQAE